MYGVSKSNATHKGDTFIMTSVSFFSFGVFLNGVSVAPNGAKVKTKTGN